MIPLKHWTVWHGTQNFKYAIDRTCGNSTDKYTKLLLVARCYNLGIAYLNDEHDDWVFGIIMRRVSPFEDPALRRGPAGARRCRGPSGCNDLSNG